MPIPGKSASPSGPVAAPLGARPASSPVTVLGGLPEVARGAEYPPLPETPIFAYFADPTSVTFVDGEPLYLPIKVGFEAGIQGVRDGSMLAASIEYEQRTNRRMMIPLDSRVVAFGSEHGGYVQRIELAPDRRGKPRHHHADVWTRYDVVGAEAIATFDAEGFLAFRRSLVDLLGPVHPGVIQATKAKTYQLAEAHRRIGHASPGMARIADSIEAQLAPRT
jgi:hypothetical protein